MEMALIETNNKLEYSIVGYSTQIGADAFGDTEMVILQLLVGHMMEIRFMGPYGFSDPSDLNFYS